MQNIIQNGLLLISLDFELFWGMRDTRTLKNYGKNIEGEHTVIPHILNLFKSYSIHATWAIVGFLFAKSFSELQDYLPKLKPSYINKNLSPYQYIKSHADKLEKIYHFAPEIIQLIQQTPNQEIATHTFSHYYCLEPGQSIHEFTADIDAAIAIAERCGLKLNSLIFPRNQLNHAYLEICWQKGITAYRGNPDKWLYSSGHNRLVNNLRRILRFIDTYFNLSGHHLYDPLAISGKPTNLPASHFFRPYIPNIWFLDKLRLKRIKKSLTQAAKQNKIFHLWWHPHNFGIHQDANLAGLREILDHYKFLNQHYNFQCLNMREIQMRLTTHGN